MLESPPCRATSRWRQPAETRAAPDCWRHFHRMTFSASSGSAAVERRSNAHGIQYLCSDCNGPRPDSDAVTPPNPIRLSGRVHHAADRIISERCVKVRGPRSVRRASTSTSSPNGLYGFVRGTSAPARAGGSNCVEDLSIDVQQFAVGGSTCGVSAYSPCAMQPLRVRLERTTLVLVETLQILLPGGRQKVRTDVRRAPAPEPGIAAKLDGRPGRFSNVVERTLPGEASGRTPIHAAEAP